MSSCCERHVLTSYMKSYTVLSPGNGKSFFPIHFGVGNSSIFPRVSSFRKPSNLVRPSWSHVAPMDQTTEKKN